MALSGQQTEQICNALLDAYDEASLRQMVRVRLDRKLEEIAGGDNLSDIVFSLVDWADRHTRVLDLIDGAYAENPRNETLRFLHAQMPRTGAWSRPKKAYRPTKACPISTWTMQIASSAGND